MITRPLLDDTVDPNWGDQITDAINYGYFATYTSTALRLAAVPSPASGYYSYLDSGDQAEGPYWFNGSNWRLPHNMPWAFMGNNTISADQTLIGAAADLTGFSISLAAVTGRRYKASFQLTAQATTGSVTQTFTIDVDGLQTIMTSITAGVAGSLALISGFHVFTVAAGTRVVKLRGQTSSGTMAIVSSSFANGRFLIEDIGASGVPT